MNKKMKSTYWSLLALLFTGCTYTWDHSHQYTYQAFDRELAQEIEIGATTPEWTLAKFGEPSNKIDQIESGVELWLYDNFGNRDVSFLFIGLETDQRETLFIEFKNGIAIDFWIINDEQSKVLEVANQEIYSKPR